MKKIISFLFVLVLFFPALAQQSDSKILQDKWLNQKACDFVVEKWLTGEPDTKGKFVLVDFWGPSCGPCRKAIPELNEWSERFKRHLVVIGVAPNPEEFVRRMKEPVIKYYSAIDTERRMAKTYGLKWYPMAVLIDPQGIIRWIGYPTNSASLLTAEIIDRVIKLYSPKPKDSQLLEDKWLNKKATEFVVEKWLTEKPDTKGKFVLIDFWGTTCGPCRRAIPDLNEWSKRFKDDLIVVGVAPNPEEMVRKMKEPVIEYYSAIDTKGQMKKVYEPKWAPMAVLIDPEGIVRWIGYPTMNGSFLTADVIEEIIKRYKK